MMKIDQIEALDIKIKTHEFQYEEYQINKLIILKRIIK